MSASRIHAAVTSTDRVSDVIARDESLIDVFVRHSPHFAKLRNRSMRRIMGRLVTIDEAARIASIPAAMLVRDLNDALGIASSRAKIVEGVATPEVDESGDDALTRPPNAPTVEVDVREDLRAGREPFSKIMSAVHKLRENEVLHLRAIFEPAPLFTLLAKRGLVHESRAYAPDDWSVWFWKPINREHEVQETHATAAPTAVDSARLTGSAVVELDVRGLLPPEPMVRTLAALETLPPGHELMQINERVPQFLLPMLAERGFACDVDESSSDRVLVRIWRPR
jgi:uncharacterized protein (DUF2249 family)